MTIYGQMAGFSVLLICNLGAYFMQHHGYIKQPADFVSWGYIFGLIAGFALRF